MKGTDVTWKNGNELSRTRCMSCAITPRAVIDSGNDSNSHSSTYTNSVNWKDIELVK